MAGLDYLKNNLTQSTLLQTQRIVEAVTYYGHICETPWLTARAKWRWNLIRAP